MYSRSGISGGDSSTQAVRLPHIEAATDLEHCKLDAERDVSSKG